MPDTDYGYALKMGRKRYQDALARGCLLYTSDAADE